MKKLDSNSVVEIPFFFNKTECKKIIKYAQKKEEYFIKENRDIDVQEAYNKNQVTTVNFNRYNFFVDNPEYIERFLKCLKKVLPWLEYPIIIQAWVNIYKMGEGIKWHNHHGLDEHSYTANIFLGGATQPGVFYAEPGQTDIIIENIIGGMLLSSCCLWHMVLPNESKISRYSIGITLHDYEAFTKDLLRACSFNSFTKGVIILHDD